MTAAKYQFSRMLAIISAAMFMIVCVLAAPMRTAAVEDTVENKKLCANEMTLLINKERIENGLQPLYLVPYLCDLANIRARECIFLFDHERPNGQGGFETLIDTSLAPYATAAENIAAGSSEAAGAFNQWMGSDYHREAMLNPCYTHIGVGVCYEPNSDYGWYWEILLIEGNGDMQGQDIPSEIVPECAGDLTGDGIVDNFDLILMRQYLAGEVKFNNAQLEAADLMVDGSVTSLDAVALQRYILGVYTDLPVQF